MKRVFLIHGWDGFPENHWFPWLKTELEKRNFTVVAPAMPNSSEPRITEWISCLKKEVGTLNEETYFVGHSIGCQTILRYLERENYTGKIPGVVFVAGWFHLANLEDEEAERIAKPWVETPLNYTIIRQKIRQLTVYLSTNDPFNCVPENARVFKEELGAKAIIEKNKGHFTSEDGIESLPKILACFTERK